MRVTFLQQMTKGLPSHGKTMIAIIVKLERVRRFLGHGNVRRALVLVNGVE